MFDTREAIGDGTAINYDGVSGLGQIDQNGRPAYGQVPVFAFDENGALGPEAVALLDVFRNAR